MGGRLEDSEAEQVALPQAWIAERPDFLRVYPRIFTTKGLALASAGARTTSLRSR